MNFNQAPYFDDFDEQKKFYKILFRPGVAVQTREINQLQTILQNQIANFGDNIFKDGSQVIPGQVQYNGKLSYIKLSAKSLGTNSLSYLEGKEISTGTLGTGVKAMVVKAMVDDGTDPDTLILTYISSDEGGSGTGAKTFSAGQTLYVVDEPALSITVLGGSASTGRSAVASVQKGVYYLKGYFVYVEEQTVVLQKYITDITALNAKVGLQYTESVVTADDDGSLYDNANTTTNYTAPGAHRFSIDAVLTSYSIDTETEDFYELIRIQDGVTQQITNRSQYNILGDTLARRTYDESGNYVVDPFKISIREHRNNSRGSWGSLVSYQVNDFIQVNGVYFVCVRAGTSALTQPTAFATADETAVVTDGTVYWRYTRSPRNNNGAYTPELGGDSSNLVYSIGRGRAYVRGYEIERTTQGNITVNKARNTSTTVSQSFTLANGNYIILDRNATWGMPDVSTGPQITLFDRVLGDSSYSTKFGYGRPVGTARVKFIDNDYTGGVKLGLYSVNMEPGKQLDRDVNSVAQIDSSAAVQTKTYKLSGNGVYRYTGNSQTSLAATANTITIPACTNSSTLFIVTSSGTFFTKVLTSGDTIQVTNTSNTVSSFLVSGIINDTSMIIKYVGGTGFATTAYLTSYSLVLPAYTVFGGYWGASTAAALTYELRPGDAVFLSSASVFVSGTVTKLFTYTDVHGDSRTRMTISSAATAVQARSGAGLDLYVQYTGQGASFVGNILGKYSVGVNSRKLTGQFSLRDVDGNTVLNPQPHQAVRIVAAGSDARLLTEQLNINDLININNYNILVTRRSDNLKVFGVCLDQAVVPSTTNYAAFVITNKVYDAGQANLLFKIDQVPAQITDNSYKIYKTENFALNNTSIITLTLNSTGSISESSFTNAPLDYLASIVDTTAITTQLGIYYVQPYGSTIQIFLNSSITNNVRVVYPVQKTATAGQLGGLKTKTLTYDQTAEILSSSLAQMTRVVLPHADVYRINKILMSRGFVTSWSVQAAATAIDVTGNYQLDDGQNDAFYDYSKLKLNPGAPTASGSIKVYYDYFLHGSGDFFTKDSYSPSQVPYEVIPDYKGVALRDYLDFRPLIGTNATLANVNMLRYGTSFTCSSNRYLPRKDKILIDKNAAFNVISSAPSNVPGDPLTSQANDIMEVFDVDLSAYTDNTDWPEIAYKVKENRRYTMKDIGNLETRIANLEEVVTLSLLEVKTKSLQIRDNKDSTLERYKTGFFVDPFRDQTNAENTPDNRFSIDPQNQTMQAHISPYGFPLVEKINYTAYTSTTGAGGELTPITAARANQNYQVTGDYITLPYTTSVVIKQLLATSSIAVCPFLTLTFLGQMKVYPDKDIYEDVTTIRLNVENKDNAQRLKEAVELGQRLYGSQYTIDAGATTKTITTKVDLGLIPYCRANTLAVVVTGLKPNTKHYPLIDGVDIRSYTTGAIKFTMQYLDLLKFYHIRPNGNKDWARWRSLTHTDTVRKRVSTKISKSGWTTERVTYFPKDYDTNLPSSKYGDAFRTAFATGASVYYREGGVVGSGVAMLQDGNTIYIANARGRLSPKYVRSRPANSYLFNGQWNIAGITGSYFSYLPIQLRTALQVCTDDTEGNLYSDDKGNLVFTIDFPNNDLQSFFSGDKHIVISDSPTDAPDDWTSRAEANYKVEGYKIVITKTTTTTRTYSPRYVPPAPPPEDPIAQSFKIPDGYDNGIFATGASVFFQAVPPSDALPLVFQLRVCDATGRPGPEEVPGTTIVKFASEITVDSSTANRATVFNFDHPVHLKPEVNYCMVLKTDSPRFRVWIAVLGQGDVLDPTKSYTTQGNLGSFFKSQNNTLWTEDQTADMKFQIHRAVFNTSVTGVAYVVNQNIPPKPLPTNPFTLMHGSAKIRVEHPNHGYRNGDLVRFHSQSYAAAYANSSGLTLAGIPVTEIFGTTIATEQVADTDLSLTVESCQLDSYVVTAQTIANLGDAATTAETLRADGGNGIFANSQVLYHVSTPQIPNISFNNTRIKFTGYKLEGHTYDNLPTSAASYTQTADVMDLNIPYVENSSPKIVLTDLNENNRFAGVSITAGSGTQTWFDSFVGRLDLNSDVDALSPAIDMSSAHLNVIQHRIDNPTASQRLGGGTLPPYGTTSTFIVYQTVVSSVTNIAFNSAEQSIVSATSSFGLIVPGRYITISGAANASNNNTSTGLRVTNVSQDDSKIFVSSNTIVDELAGSSITIRQLQDFTEEATFIDASGESKYITRKINLENPASQLKIIMDINCPAEANFDIYYKVGSATQDFNQLVWDNFEQLTTPSKDNNRSVFTEYETTITGFDSSGFPIDLSPFTAFQLKIVMRSTNGARIPKFANLRVIAHA